MTDGSAEAMMRLLLARVPAIARAAVATPTKRLGTVADDAELTTYVNVLVDGDDTAISVLNGTGAQLTAGQRVVVDFYPPNGAIVQGILSTPDLAARPWGASWGRVAEDSGAGSAFDATTPTQLTLSAVPVQAGRSYEARYTFRARCDTADTVISLALDLDGGGGFVALRNLPMTFPVASVTVMTEAVEWSEVFDAGADQTVDLRIVSQRISAAAATTTPNLARIQVFDAGPTL